MSQPLMQEFDYLTNQVCFCETEFIFKPKMLFLHVFKIITYRNENTHACVFWFQEIDQESVL